MDSRMHSTPASNPQEIGFHGPHINPPVSQTENPRPPPNPSQLASANINGLGLSAQPNPTQAVQSLFSSAQPVPDHPPPSASIATQSYGNIRLINPVVICTQLTNAQLLSITQSAPLAERTAFGPFPTKEQLITDFFRLRDLEVSSLSLSSNEAKAALQKLMKLTPQQIIDMAATAGEDLVKLMNSALKAEPNLFPRTIPSHPHQAASIAITWLFSAYRQIHPTQRQTTPQPVTTQNLPSITPLLSIARPSLSGVPQATDQESSDDEEPSAAHKSKKQFIVPKNFSFGVSNSEKSLLLHYPGKGTTSTTLRVQELMGPAILSMMISSGTDIPTFLQHSFQHWKRSPSGQPYASEIDAVTLGRIIHLEMLIHDSPKQALEQRPSLEVALRRLYAILHVQESISTGVDNDYKDAWEEVEHILEIMPQGTVRSQELEEHMTRHISLKKRRCTGIKSIQEFRTKKRNSKSHRNSRANDADKSEKERQGRS